MSSKKPFNPFSEFGEFLAKHLDGSIFDVEEVSTPKTKEVTNATERMGNDGNGSNAVTEGKQRTGSTFTNPATKKARAPVNSGNGGTGGNDGNGVSSGKGNESDSDENESESK